jgi:hypothetical protein
VTTSNPTALYFLFTGHPFRVPSLYNGEYIIYNSNFYDNLKGKVYAMKEYEGVDV